MQVCIKESRFLVVQSKESEKVHFLATQSDKQDVQYLDNTASAMQPRWWTMLGGNTKANIHA